MIMSWKRKITNEEIACTISILGITTVATGTHMVIIVDGKICNTTLIKIP